MSAVQGDSSAGPRRSSKVVSSSADDSPSVASSSGIPPPGQDWDDLPSAHELYKQYVKSLLYGTSIKNPPKVKLIEFVTPAEWAQKQVDCLAAKGFSAKVGGQGGISFDPVPKDQASALDLATYECSAEYAIDPRTQVPLPRVRAEMEYHYLVDTVTPCVRKLGFPVKDAPTLETWLGQYYANSYPWDPYGEVPGPSLNEVYVKCPHDAPNLYPPLKK